MLAQQTDTFIDDRQFQRLCDLVYQHCGINLHDGKRELVQARVTKQIRGRAFATAGDYLDSVMADPTGEEFASLIDALSTNLTSFFREPAHFAFLADRLLPDIVERKRRRRDQRIRAWSAACSTGEEPYSIVLTLLDRLQGQGTWDVKVLATDISRHVLRVADRGVYDAGRVAAVPGPLRTQYFARATGADTRVPGEPRGAAAGQRVRIADEVRRRVAFNYLNLMDAWPFDGPFDFIFCRNVMIYFDKPTQERLVNRLWGCLEPGGVLFTGHSESLTGIAHRFQYVRPTIYARP